MSGRSQAACRSRRPAQGRLSGSDGARPGAAGTIGRARRSLISGLKGGAASPGRYRAAASCARPRVPSSANAPPARSLRRHCPPRHKAPSFHRRSAAECEKYKLASACIAPQRTVISCISQGRKAGGSVKAEAQVGSDPLRPVRAARAAAPWFLCRRWFRWLGLPPSCPRSASAWKSPATSRPRSTPSTEALAVLRDCSLVVAQHHPKSNLEEL